MFAFLFPFVPLSPNFSLTPENHFFFYLLLTLRGSNQLWDLASRLCIRARPYDFSLAVPFICEAGLASHRTPGSRGICTNNAIVNYPLNCDFDCQTRVEHVTFTLSPHRGG